MDIFLRNISWNVKEDTLTETFADILHNDPFRTLSPGVPINFKVTLFPDRRFKGAKPHSGSGLLTLPSTEIGDLFLSHYGDASGLREIVISRRKLSFQASNKPLRADIVTSIRRNTYLSPDQLAAKEKILKDSKSNILFRQLQFGRECRDGSFSVEWERKFLDQSQCTIEVDQEQRLVQIVFPEPYKTEHELYQFLLCDTDPTLSITLRYSLIQDIGINRDLGEPSIYFTMNVPASFNAIRPVSIYESLLHPNRLPPLQKPISYLDDDHRLVAPYISTNLRVVLDSVNSLREFEKRASKAHRRVRVYTPRIVRRGLYEKNLLHEIYRWLGKLPSQVAFQCAALLHNCLLDAQELHSTCLSIDRLTRRVGEAKSASFLRHFASVLEEHDFGMENRKESQPVVSLLKSTQEEYDFTVKHLDSSTEGVIDCFHAIVTPISIRLSGPFPERSNRVLRMFPGKEHHFLRVSFTDENNLQYRFDRDTDGPAFIRERVGGILSDGISAAGRTFRFLAYSMSALKDHAVWFMEPFVYDGQHITPHSIRQGLGDFSKVINYPALYGARISQAFTATDPGVKIEPEELLEIEDIERNNSVFTDGKWSDLKIAPPTDDYVGVGTISPKLAKEVWKKQRTIRRRHRERKHIPAALQVRLGGAKGMLSVDVRLEGRLVQLRPSMTKFESSSLEIEVARIFTRPAKMYLNRPMIMLLEGLGVDSSVFLRLQRDAVENTKKAVEDIERAANLVESIGLGSAFRLPSVWLGLKKLGVTFGSHSTSLTKGNGFLKGVLDCITNHALRELKHRARIPVPGSWTLVGVADIHRELNEGEIFACILEANETEPLYLEGPCVITRSPVIHPGDLQLVRAIGRPRQGSMYSTEPLANTVVFSVLGSRSLPSCLGGGDLDGDEFNVIMLHDLHPRRYFTPASYAPPVRKRLDRESTVDDLVGFVVEYINSDIVGLVANTWLILADQTSDFVYDKVCLLLAELHSDAVDYPKSGIPVQQNKLPKVPKVKPDWAAPETAGGDLMNYYKSDRAIGILFRDIQLPILRSIKNQGNEPMEEEDEDVFEIYSGMNALSLHSSHSQGIVGEALYTRLYEFLDEDELEDSVTPEWAHSIFSLYQNELRFICRSHTLSFKKSARLSEQEVLVGTIVAKTSQPRRRTDLMAQMRDRTSVLVSQVKEEISGGKETPALTRMQRSWMAWKLSHFFSEREVFGAESFGVIAIGSVLDAINAFENQLQ